MKEEKPRKNILARIFCKHDWHKVSDLYSYSSVEAMNDKHRPQDPLKDASLLLGYEIAMADLKDYLNK